MGTKSLWLNSHLSNQGDAVLTQPYFEGFKYMETSTALKSIELADYDLFAFGDSLTDIGRLFTLTLEQLPPSPPYFDGRFSNGPLAVETLAEQLGVKHSQPTNFAIGGALTDATNNLDTVAFQFGGLLTQIDQFSSEASALGADGKDLYFVWAGANDFLGLVENPVEDPTPVLLQAVSNIATAVSTLASLGAENILVALAPNLGRVPLSLQANLLAPLTALTNAFNAALADALSDLEATLEHTNIVLVDLFTTSEEIAQDPAAFGFTNVEDPYLTGFTPTDPAADPDTFFFWDGVHPTTRSHSLFADTFYEATVLGITEDIRFVGTLDADRLVSFSGNDILEGREGDDVLIGNPGDDLLLGADGSDRLFGEDGRDRMFGGEGNDRLIGLAGNDTGAGGSGNDQALGGDGNDRVAGNAGSDRLVGGAGDDQLLGGADDDALIGGEGDDRLLGAGGDDRMQGNLDDDLLNGGAGSDRQFGGAGSDRLNGQGSDDVLRGGADNDILRGGAGDDRLIGELGSDQLFGGLGRDRFVIRSGQGTDRITDFEDGQDLIALQGLTFAQVTIQQRGNNVSVATGNEVLLLVLNTSANLLTLADFV